MKSYLIFILFISSNVFSQTPFSEEKIDSINHYIKLREKYLSNNKYGEAISNNQKAINYSIVNNLTEEQISQYYNLGELYYNLKKYNEALNAFNKSLYLAKSSESNLIQISTYYFLGKCYMEKRSYNNALICFTKAKSLNHDNKSSYYSELINIEIGIQHKYKGNNIEANKIFNAIISKADSDSIIEAKSEALYQIGIYESENNNNEKALNHLKKAFELNSKNDNLVQKLSITQALSKVYEKLDDKTNAFLYLKLHFIIKESILLSDNEKLDFDDYDNYKETERLKELEIKIKEKKQEEKNNKFAKLISFLAISLISILSLLSLALYRNNIIRKQSNLLLEEKNKELIIAKDDAIRSSKARSEFLSTVSHELRTPLNAINGITHLLIEDNPKESQINYLESLQFSGNYLTNFINDILEINKIESNKVQVENIAFNLKELLDNIHNSLKELATQNQNKFYIKTDSEIPDYIIGDPTKLSQILLNLINNALKFTKNGSVIVTTKLNVLEDQNANLHFEVIDTGIGIPEDKLETIFDSFSQGSIGINRKYGGTGLGLTIVKKLVEILGGNIKLESQVNFGSSFSFILPFQVSNKPLEIEKTESYKTDSQLKGKKILVVEDNKINQMVTKKMLENKGVLCEITENGEDAIEIVKNNKYDLILMDIHLPGINGTIASQKIREFDKFTPIIALTAISLNENRDTILSYGINDIITKPFIPEVFYTTITNYI